MPSERHVSSRRVFAFASVQSRPRRQRAALDAIEIKLARGRPAPRGRVVRLPERRRGRADEGGRVRDRCRPVGGARRAPAAFRQPATRRRPQRPTRRRRWNPSTSGASVPTVAFSLTCRRCGGRLGGFFMSFFSRYGYFLDIHLPILVLRNRGIIDIPTTTPHIKPEEDTHSLAKSTDHHLQTRHIRKHKHPM